MMIRGAIIIIRGEDIEIHGDIDLAFQYHLVGVSDGVVLAIGDTIHIGVPIMVADGMIRGMVVFIILGDTTHITNPTIEIHMVVITVDTIQEMGKDPEEV